MIKRLFLLITLIFLSVKIFSQEKITIPTKFPTEYGEFTFELGTKIVIELKDLGNDKYAYRVLSIEPFEGYYSMEKREKLFSKEPKANTIELFFMGAFYNEGKDDKDWKTLLNLRNNLSVPITFKADIKYYYSDKFENTSISGAFPSASLNEIWGHKIDYIKLYDFEKIKTK